MKKYSQEEQNQILRKLNAGVIGKRKDWVWESVAVRQKWNKNKVIKIAKKITDLEEFASNYNGAFMFAKRNNFLEEVTSHMQRNATWDINSVKKVAKLYKTRLEFKDSKHYSAYQWALRNKKLDIVFPLKHKNQVSKDTIAKIAKNCKNVTQLYNIKNSYYKIAKREGWLDEWFPKKK